MIKKLYLMVLKSFITDFKWNFLAILFFLHSQLNNPFDGDELSVTHPWVVD